MTYDELVAAVLAWTNKPEIEQSIPTFIQLAEAQMNRALTEKGVLGAEQRDTSTISTEYAVTPSDLEVVGSLTLGGYPVENVTEVGLADLKARFPNQPAGRPTVFTTVGGQFRFWPVPDTGYVAELTYIKTIPALTSLSPTNWVSTSAPDAYLYGCLVQAAIFLKDGDGLRAWAPMYADALDGIVKNERGKRGSQNTPAYRAHMPHRWFHGVYRPIGC